ncbi:MAG TPA: flippase [Methylotenera sp.]|nr:flippase [Methylotenera sp.]
MLENLIRLTAVAAVSFWIARHLGPSQFGILNFASALVAIFLSVATMGFDTPVILRLTQTERPGEVLGTVLFIRTLAGLLLLLLAVGLIFSLKQNEPTTLWVSVIVSLSIFVNAPTIFDYWFKANTSAFLPATARTLGTLLAVAAKVICIVMGLGVVALAWTITLEALLTSIGLIGVYLYATKRLTLNRLSVNQKLAKLLIVESWPYLLSAVAVVAYMKIDVVMLGYLSTNTETGIYSLAQKLSEVLYMVPIVLIDSAYPALAKRFLDSEQNDSKHGQMLFDLAVGGSLIATIVSVLLARPVIEFVFGESYQSSIQIFYLHAWSCVAIAMNTARHRWFAAIGLQRYAPIVTVLGLFVNVLMNLALIPSLGAMGAAITTVASYFISGYLASFMFYELREIGWMQTRALWPWSRLNTRARIWITK